MLTNFVAIMLAAGISSRTGSINKLDRHWRGKPLLAQALERVTGAGLGDIVVVTGPLYRADARRVISGFPGSREIFNEKAATGMGSSIAAGVSAIAQDGFHGAFICLGDMPMIEPGDFTELAVALTGEITVARPTFGGKPGHPVLFGNRHFDELRKLSGEAGAAAVIDGLSGKAVLTMASSHAGVVYDLDKLDDFL